MQVSQIKNYNKFGITNPNLSLPESLNKKNIDINQKNTEISNICYKPSFNKRASVITFKGEDRNINEAIYVDAELNKESKKGGVATVMEDYQGVHIIPYYNGKIKYNQETGQMDKNSSVDV